MDELGDAIGVSRRTVWALILNESDPSAMTVSLVAAYLELPMDTVWAWHDVRELA